MGTLLEAGTASKQMRANPVAFCDTSTKYAGVMQLVAYFKTDYPGLSFERELVKGLADFCLSVDCDFYFLHSATREDS